MKIISEIEFPELMPLNELQIPDVKLRVGSVGIVPEHPKGFYSDSLDVSPDEYRLVVKDIAKFHVVGGETIVVEPDQNVSWDLLRLFCLSNAFAALLHQRKTIPLHAAALLKNESLIMILGDSGVGKSTTMAGLLARGLLPFSDDVCVPVVSKEGDWMFYSSYPMMKFWRSTLELEGIHIKVDRQIRPDLEKYGTYFHDQFDLTPRRPGAFFVLRKRPGNGEISIKKVNGMALFQHLESNAYRGEYLEAADLKIAHFQFFATLSMQAPCFLVERSEEGCDHQMVTQAIWEELSKLHYG